MACWWKHHDITAFSDEEKQMVEDLTGCIPLLLIPFMRCNDKTLDFLEPQIWMDPILESVRTETLEFSTAKKSQLDSRTYVHSVWSFVDHSSLAVGFMTNTCPCCAIAYWVAELVALDRI